MGTIVDSENSVSSLEEAPDRLRAEIGRYFNPQSTGPYSFVDFRLGIKTDFLNPLESEGTQLFPTKKARIFVSGREGQFRDQAQWTTYIRKTIRPGTAFLDHQFSFTPPEIENSFAKNYHDPAYEDITKVFGSNQLLNWNLVSYPHKGEMPSVSRVGDLRTRFDEGDYLVTSNSLPDLISQYPSRISNYDGPVEEIALKQRNIFDLQRPAILDESIDGSLTLQTSYLVQPSDFPYYYRKRLSRIETADQRTRQRFNDIVDRYKKRKSIFQSIKQNLSFSNREFNVGDDNNVPAKIYNLLDIITTTRIVSISEQTDELFLVPQQETDFADITSRFADQINTVRFLSSMRDFLGEKSRKIEDIFDASPSETFFLGYKIEKYLDNDAGNPIQTYYTNDMEFYDTQLKYGRKYIYKTKLLIGILGSSYTYSELFVSKNETQMEGVDGQTPQSYPDGFTEIAHEKYRAYVDVEATPSFQVMEYQVDEDEVAFVDTPVLPPQVDFQNDSKKASVEFFFSPIFAYVESVRPNPATPEELIRPLVPLTEEDERISNLVALSKTNGANPDYFTGIYEIYRMSKPPQEEADFADHFLTNVDDQTSLAFREGMSIPTTAIDNMNGYFEDFIIPNRKYYYAFRALTYHGTPSNLTIPFEVELLRDSDEYKVNTSQYKYPSEENYVQQKMTKRIIKISPNIERLLFSEEEKTPTGLNFKLDDGSMLGPGATKIKIRVTSKHTGKKIDLNLNLILKDETNSQ
jgi:hypothetical protein